jgi:hypothetical protein
MWASNKRQRLGHHDPAFSQYQERIHGASSFFRTGNFPYANMSTQQRIAPGGVYPRRQQNAHALQYQAIAPPGFLQSFSNGGWHDDYPAHITQANTVAPTSFAGASSVRPTFFQLYGFTPFGIYCRFCDCAVGSSSRAIERHAKEKHQTDTPDEIERFVSVAKDEVARLSRERNPKEFVKAEVHGFVCSCGETIRHEQNISRHCKQKKIPCDRAGVGKQKLFVTICGRLVVHSALTTAQSALKTSSVAPRQIKISGEQVGEDEPLFLPPDYFNTDDLDMTEDHDLNDAEHAKSIYVWLKSKRLSIRRKRKFVRGCLYKNIFEGYHMIDASGDSSNVRELEVSLKSGEISVVRISSASNELDVLDAIVELGESLPLNGNCRREVGDLGDMYALGYRSSKTGQKYKYTNYPDVSQAMKKASVKVANMMKRLSPSDLADIQQAERNKKSPCPPLEEMGGIDGPGTCIMISRNLANASHLDINDKSRSFAIWVEKRKGKAGNWYFVMPDVSINGSKGVIIKLFHGCVISWDGRVIRHCTSVTDVGEGNNVYGCMFGSCRD